MPNYCRGQLRIRGKFENIIQFIENEVRTYDYSKGEEPVVDLSRRKIHRYDDEFSLWIENGCAYVEETHRNFIDDGIYETEKREDGTAVLVVNLFAAWNIKTEPYEVFSKKYDIEFRIYAFESGMQFNRDIWIDGGHAVKNETIKFKDYDWECIAPRIGG